MKLAALARLLGLCLFALGVTALLGVLALERLLSPPLPLRSPALRDHVFEGVTLVEPGRGRAANATLLLKQGRIASPGPLRPEKASTRFAGAFVLPGLIDLHVHYPPSFALGSRELFGLLFLAHGVTSVRDTGSLWGGALDYARESRAGALAEPHIFACGPFLTGLEPAPVGMRLVANAADARQAVTELSSEGADCVKIHNGLSRDSVLAVISEARRVGLPVVAHLPESSSLETLRGSEVQHLMRLSPSWTRVRPDEIQRYVDGSRAAGIPHTPTLVVFDQVYRRHSGTLASSSAERWLPRYLREVLWSAELNPAVRMLEASTGARRDRIHPMQRAVRALRDAGVPLQLGTDTPNPGVIPGAAVHRELALLVESGLTPEQAWVAGTRAAGAALGIEKLGTLEPGAPADLLFFREDPTRDLAALETLEAVAVGGRVYRRSELEAALERQREYFEGDLYDRVTVALSSTALRLIAPDSP